MMELRRIDPTTLLRNAANPRHTPVPQAMEDQLLASVKAIGIIQPPVAREVDGRLEVIVGHRRVKAAIAAGLGQINVLVGNADAAADAMKAVSENLVRASFSSVDIWRATEALEAQGWNEQAIADALALPLRTIRRLKLLAHLHPAMLDVMAAGDMPGEDRLRTIANASREEQAEVWKKYKPKKGQDVPWFEIARALSKRRIGFAAARFDEALAKAHGVEWQDDLFAPAGEDGRYTTNVDGFFGAQQEYLANHLPPRGTLLQTDENGRYTLPRTAELVYGKPGKGDIIGHYLDACSGAIRTVAYRLPQTQTAAKAKGAEAAPARSRPDVTQKGRAIIGDLRTDALHQALQEGPIADDTLLALLVLAFGGANVTVQSGTGNGGIERRRICDSLTDGGVLSADLPAIRAAARDMLTIALSCRDNMTNSGVVARIAGAAIDATAYLPNMATDTFLPCLSKAALERTASSLGVRIEARAKETRARLIERLRDGRYVHPDAAFRLAPDALTPAADKGEDGASDDAHPAEGAGGEVDDDGEGDDAVVDDDGPVDAAAD